jgi:NAD-dependent deacetylase
MAAPTPLVVLSGAGLSAASGLSTFRDAGGLWEGHRVQDVATPEAWARDPALVRHFYDERRLGAEGVAPNAGHLALARLQRAVGPEGVVLVTQNVDGLLQAAGAVDVIEMHGGLSRLRCERAEAHPRVPVRGRQDPSARCAACGAPLRPDIVWFGEVPHQLERIDREVRRARRFVAVGTSGVVYPAAGLASTAHRLGVRTVEINPVPSRAPWFDEVVP